jgi:hypothetical protein
MTNKLVIKPPLVALRKIDFSTCPRSNTRTAMSIPSVDDSESSTPEGRDLHNSL